MRKGRMRFFILWNRCPDSSFPGTQVPDIFCSRTSACVPTFYQLSSRYVNENRTWKSLWTAHSPCHAACGEVNFWGARYAPRCKETFAIRTQLHCFRQVVTLRYLRSLGFSECFPTGSIASWNLPAAWHSPCKVGKPRGRKGRKRPARALPTGRTAPNRWFSLLGLICRYESFQ